jgi:hypothetical protein
MIGKIIIGKSLGGCIKYCLEDKRQKPGKELEMKDRAEVILYNNCFGSERELLQQFNDVRQLNPKLSKPVMHITLGLAPGEQLTREKLMEICQECARDLQFEKNQYIAVLHKDTKHQHVHIVANRVGYDGHTVSDSRNYQKIAQFCRKMELKYDLQKVLSPRQFLSKEQRLIPRHDTRKERLKADIQQTLELARNFTEFEQKMKALGYQVIKGRGIAFIDNKKVYIKGSEVGFSLKTIEKVFAYKDQLQNLKTAQIKQRQQNEQAEKTAKFLTPAQKLLLQFRQEKQQDLLPDIKLEKFLETALHQLMKPEYVHQGISPKLSEENIKKKKKRRKHHL